MKKRPIDLQEIMGGLADLQRIAAEHPELIDHSQANWTEEDIKAMIEDQNIFTVQEAADMLRCQIETIRRAIRAGKLKAALIGREFRITKADLQDYFTRQGGGSLFEE